MHIIGKIQDVGYSAGQTTWFLQQITCKEKTEGEKPISQWSLTFLAPGTGFMKDNFLQMMGEG